MKLSARNQLKGKILDVTKLEELTELVRRLPSNSVLLTTFSALGKKYGGQ